MCKTISPFFYYSELKRYERKKVLSDTNIYKLSSSLEIYSDKSFLLSFVAKMK